MYHNKDTSTNQLELNTYNSSECVGVLTHCLYRNSGRSLSSCAFLNAVMVLSSLWNQKNAHFIKKIPAEVASLWQEQMQFRTVWELGEGTEVVSLMIRWAGQLPQAQPSKRAPLDPGSRVRAKQTQTFRMTGHSRRKSNKHGVLGSCPRPQKSLSFFQKIVTFHSALWPHPYLTSEGLITCLLSKSFQAKVDVTLPHGLWNSQKDFTDHSSILSLTIIIHLSFEGKTPLKGLN